MTKRGLSVVPVTSFLTKLKHFPRSKAIASNAGWALAGADGPCNPLNNFSFYLFLARKSPSPYFQIAHRSLSDPLFIVLPPSLSTL